MISGRGEEPAQPVEIANAFVRRMLHAEQWAAQPFQIDNAFVRRILTTRHESNCVRSAQLILSAAIMAFERLDPAPRISPRKVHAQNPVSEVSVQCVV
jgi:hypothetical protein